MGKQVQLLTIAATATWRGAPGDIVELPDAEAIQLIAGGYAIEPQAAEIAEPLPARADRPPVWDGTRGRWLETLRPGDQTARVAGPAAPSVGDGHVVVDNQSIPAVAEAPKPRPASRKKAKPRSRRGASKAPSGE